MIALSVWWLMQDQDGPELALGRFGIVFGLGFTGIFLLALRNMIRVAQKGQAALYAEPDRFDKLIGRFVGAIFPRR